MIDKLSDVCKRVSAQVPVDGSEEVEGGDVPRLLRIWSKSQND